MNAEAEGHAGAVKLTKGPGGHHAQHVGPAATGRTKAASDGRPKNDGARSKFYGGPGQRSTFDVRKAGTIQRSTFGVYYTATPTTEYVRSWWQRRYCSRRKTYALRGRFSDLCAAPPSYPKLVAAASRDRVRAPTGTRVGSPTSGSSLVAADGSSQAIEYLRRVWLTLSQRR